MLILAWITYTVYGIVSLFFSPQVSIFYVRRVMRKDITLIAEIVFSIAMYITMINAYGFWKMIGYQAIICIVIGIVSFIREKNNGTVFQTLNSEFNVM